MTKIKKATCGCKEKLGGKTPQGRLKEDVNETKDNNNKAEILATKSNPRNPTLTHRNPTLSPNISSINSAPTKQNELADEVIEETQAVKNSNKVVKVKQNPSFILKLDENTASIDEIPFSDKDL